MLIPSCGSDFFDHPSRGTGFSLPLRIGGSRVHLFMRFAQDYDFVGDLDIACRARAPSLIL
jgi:hypothetical protein